MKTKAQGNGPLSFILLIGGIALLVAALAMDIMGSKFAGRGAMLILGIVAFFAGLYLIPCFHLALGVELWLHLPDVVVGVI